MDCLSLVKIFMKNYQNIAAWIVTIIASLMPLYGAYGKLFTEGMQSYMAACGLGDWTTIIGIGELLSVILFIVPKTHKFGLLLMSALMGGAITLHMSRGESFTMQSVILVVVWLSGYLRSTTKNQT